jgi:hypothetical protein
VLGGKAIPTAIIANMAIRNIDVIAQAMERLPLHKTWTVPPEAPRANVVAPPRVGSPLVAVIARLPLVPRGRVNERVAAAQRLGPAPMAAARSLARVVLHLARRVTL